MKKRKNRREKVKTARKIIAEARTDLGKKRQAWGDMLQAQRRATAAGVEALIDVAVMCVEMADFSDPLASMDERITKIYSRVGRELGIA